MTPVHQVRRLMFDRRFERLVKIKLKLRLQRFLSQVKQAVADGSQILPPIESLSPSFSRPREMFASYVNGHASSVELASKGAKMFGITEPNIKTIAACSPEALVDKFLGGVAARRCGGQVQKNKNQ